MSAQEQEARKNYIGILCESTKEQGAPESLPKSDRQTRNYFLSLLATMLKPGRDSG